MGAAETAPILIEVGARTDLRHALADAGLIGPRPVVVVVGGAAGLSDDLATLVEKVVRDVVVPAAIDVGAVIVDGGTDSGVMRIVGRAHAVHQPRTPLVGVAVQQLVRGTGDSTADDAADAEPHHTHLVLVPGDEWGDESSWLADVATEIGGGAPTATVVVNGGAITALDAAHSVAAGRPVVVVAGSGRMADQLLADGRGNAPATVDAIDARAAAAEGLLVTLDPARPVAESRATLTVLLSPPRR